jgi:hypothetical protein
MKINSMMVGRWLVAMTITMSGAVNASLELQGRDINGNSVAGNDAGAVFEYDSALNITWLRDANSNGVMTWAQANTWATTLTVGSYSGWRLPTVSPVAGTFNYTVSSDGTTDLGYGATGSGWGLSSEMGHLFYATLGNIGKCAPAGGVGASCTVQVGYGLTNPGDFTGLNPGTGQYWSGTDSALNASYAVAFRPFDGYQDLVSKTNTNALYAMAVRPGDVLSVSAVPVPASFALFSAGLGVLGLVARQRKAVTT